jgi:divalent metal cation (Fe/Co/Zn/Cd) transporter
VVGLAITAAIGLVLYSAVKEVFARLLDAVDPALVAQAERILGDTPGVLSVDSLRMRWVGHSLRVEAEIGIDAATPLSRAHEIVHNAEHALLHAVDRLAAASIHANPAGESEVHDGLRHHNVEGGLARP